MLEHRALKHLDSGVPVRVSLDRTLRVKVIDACGMTSPFCHNEGTPVSTDNRPGQPLTSTGPSGRTSLYLASNGARFLSAPIHPDPAFATAHSRLRDALGFNEVHLTGGEPTLHPQLPQLIRLARQAGYRVSVTSNGENGTRTLPACAEAGLDHVNFSIFGTTPEELAQVRAPRLRSPRLAASKIAAVEKSLQASMDLGLGTRANVVLPDAGHFDRIRRRLECYSPQLSVRVLTSLADGEASLDAIDQALEEVSVTQEEVRLIAGTSGFRIRYRLPDRRLLVVKHIRPLRLPDTCTGCRFNNSVDCEEGYYGVRLYRDTDGTFHVGVCIQRMDLCLPVEEFVTSNLCGEVRRLREQDHHDLTT